MLICTLQMNCRLPVCSYTSTHRLHKDPDCSKVSVALQKRCPKAFNEINFSSFLSEKPMNFCSLNKLSYYKNLRKDDSEKTKVLRKIHV